MDLVRDVTRPTWYVHSHGICPQWTSAKEQTFLNTDFVWGNIDVIFSFSIIPQHWAHGVTHDSIMSLLRQNVATSFWRNSDIIIASCVRWAGTRLTYVTWWRHQIEIFSALLAICAGNSPVRGEFPAQRPVTRSFDVFFDLRPNKRLGKQSWGWWYETPSSSLWRHRNEPWYGCCWPGDVRGPSYLGLTRSIS